MDLNMTCWDIITDPNLNPKYQLILDKKEIKASFWQEIYRGEIMLSSKELSEENSAMYHPKKFREARERLLRTIEFPNETFLNCDVASVINAHPDIGLEYFPIIENKKVWFLNKTNDIYFEYTIYWE